MKKFLKNKKAFSLAEIMVAMLVSIILMTAVTMIFASLFTGYKNAKKTQKNLENAQQAISLMAKSIRTSSIKSPTVSTANATDITIYNYSLADHKCERYALASNKIRRGDTAAADSDESQCISGISVSDMTDSSVYMNSLRFNIVYPTSGSEVGKVTISAEVCESSACKFSTKIQTTVSLRNYN